MSDSPKVVIVDDDIDELSSVVELLKKEGVEVDALDPEDVHATGLRAADLVLVDWNLERWPGTRAGDRPLSARPQDGLALAEVYRSHLGATHSGRPTAFALHSGQLGDLRRGVPETIQEYALARAHNLEWVFSKGQPVRAVERFSSLAQAVRALPHPWPAGIERGWDALAQWLEIPDDPLARESVERCHPPVNELARNSNGLATVRWLAQRVLPYPGFLIGDWYVASRLGVDQETLREDVEKRGPLSLALAPARYHGALADFVEPRWWRTRVDDIVWDATAGSDDVRAFIASVAPEVEPLSAASPVVCLGSDHRPTEIVDVNEAVRVAFDDRPTFALPAWVSAEVARDDPEMQARVLQEDADRVA